MKIYTTILRHRWKISGCCLLVLIGYYFILPTRLFDDPYSSVVEARSGELLCATIAEDGQWRFPPTKEIPEKYKTALLTFEDKRFYSHPGVDVLSLLRATRDNLKRGKVVSGGSTITMQVVRLSRKGKSRSFWEKLAEIVMATRMEIRYSKDDILSLYAAHAPFGGNVVGLEAACWRYFGRSEKNLSWAEAALLAVLPNSPAMIHPGRNRDLLKQKRNHLLDKMAAAGVIDVFTCDLAKEEPVPEDPVPLPRHARHIIQRARIDGLKDQKIRTSIDYSLQTTVEQFLEDHHKRLKGNQIHNAAAIVASVSTGEVLAYAGNIFIQNDNGSEVDIIVSPRSTGSILKPFLYSAMLDDGSILPGTLLPDIPVHINGFAPKNFSREFDGAVSADKALIRSLNVPAVHMLREYRYERFYDLLTNMGMTTLNRSPDHYGLAMILGGAEGTLWDITGMYASMSRTLNSYFSYPYTQRYSKNDFHPLRYFAESPDVKRVPSEVSWLSASSIYCTFNALKDLYRPGEETGWRLFESSKKIAWKTGTSFGFRDGWAVGVTPEYVVGVWVGNADGEGRPGLTGTDAAAPLMFDIFSQVGNCTWFKKPVHEMQTITICPQSGFRNSRFCPEADTVEVPLPGLESTSCPYHKSISLTNDLKFQINSECADLRFATQQSWFVLPPVQEFYFKSKHIHYKSLPPFLEGCPASGITKSMEVVYPKGGAKVFIPRNLQGHPGHAVFQLAHRNPKATVFWHLDGNFIGSTQKNHNLPLNPVAGKHTLMVVDEAGESLEQSFEVLPNL